MIRTAIDGFARWYLDVATRLRVEREGATAVEYGLMVALIAAVIIGAVTALGTSTSTKFCNVAAAIGSC